jgi:hypothetical protein
VTTFLLVPLIWINTLFSARLGTNVLLRASLLQERDPRGDLYMEHDQKVWSTAALLLERYGQNASEVARGWSRDLTERQEPEAAARCLEIVDAANKLLTASAVREPKLADVMSGAVTGQMMRADRVEQRDVERLMKRAKRRRR